MIIIIIIINITNQDIYSRRNNIEICNVPENIPEEDLEEYVLKLLKSIGIDIGSYDLVAVHRMGRRTNTLRNVIVRFLNRKDAYRSLKLRYRLQSISQYKKYSSLKTYVLLIKRFSTLCTNLKNQKLSILFGLSMVIFSTVSTRQTIIYRSNN